MDKLLNNESDLYEAIVSTVFKETKKKLAEAEQKIKTRWILFLVSIVVSLGAFGAAGYMYYSRILPLEQIISIAVVAALFLLVCFVFWLLGIRLRKALLPDTRIKSLKIGLLPIKSLKREPGTYLVDQAGLLKPVSLTFTLEQNVIRLQSILKKFQELVESMPHLLLSSDYLQVPVDESTEQKLFSEEGDLHQVYQELINLMDHLEANTSDVHLLNLNESMLTDLEALGSQIQGIWENAPKCRPLTEKALEDVLSIIRQIEGDLTKDADDAASWSSLQDYLYEVMERLENATQRFSHSREYALGGVMKSFNRDLEGLSAFASFNSYCPRCNEEVISNSANGEWDADNNSYPVFDPATRMTVVPKLSRWECPVCGFQTDRPFPVHRLLDELIYPALERLLQENRIQRLKTYQEAEDRILECLRDEEKEILEYVEKTEKESRDIQSKVREVASNIEGARATVSMLQDEISRIESLKDSRMASVTSEINQIAGQISEYREKTMTEYNQTMDAVVAAASRDIEQLAQIARQEEQARMEVQRQIAQNTQAIASNTQEMKASLSSIDKNTQRVADNTDEMKDSLSNINKNTQTIADNTGEMKDTLKDVSGKLSENNAMTGAMAKQNGCFKASPPNFPGMFQNWGKDVKQAITGQSDYDRMKAG